MAADAPPPPHEIVFELCADSLEACLMARHAGAARIELCADLAVDGLTPSHGLTQAAVEQSGLPVYMLLRPRAGNFVYTDAEFALMQEDLRHGLALGVSGFVLGLLHANHHIDVERTRDLVQLAAPLEVTFHRAFDSAPDLSRALEEVIATGCRRVLTSGGAPDVVSGAGELANLVRQAAGRIEIAVGGGLRSEHAAHVLRETGASHFHGSARRLDLPRSLPGQEDPGAGNAPPEPGTRVSPSEIERLLQGLRAGAELL